LWYIRQNNDMAIHTFNILSLTSGVGGLDLGLKLAVTNSRVVCYCELNAFSASVLVARMEDKSLDEAPIWDSVVTFDGKPWCGVVDCIIGGYPCQPFSVAGRQLGTSDPRHLWPHFARIIREVKPAFLFFENVAGHLRLGFPEVHNELQGMGYAVEAGLFSANEVGAPHKRERLFILAYSEFTRTRSHNGEVGRGLGTSDVRQGNREVGTGWFDATGTIVADSSNISGEVSSPSESRNTGRGTSASASGESIGDVANPISIRPRGGNQGFERPEIQGRETAEDKTEGYGIGLADSKSLLGKWRIGVGDIGEQSEVKTRDASGDLEYSNLAGLGGYTPDGEYSNKLTAWPPSPASANEWREVLRLDKTVEPAIRRVVDGVDTRLDSSIYAYRNERLRAVGNGVVPLTAAYAFTVLYNRLMRGVST
jgi:DNA (cytosine-5)-methyltransferase 1